MKRKKSGLSLVLILTMLLTIISSSLAFADTTDAIDYGTSLTKLQSLGIIDQSITDVNSQVDRAQLVKSIVIAEALNATAANSQGATIFPDVEPNSELSGYVNVGLNLGTKVGVNQGVVYGTPDGNFHGEKVITYGEACTIMVRLLGYTDTDKELQGASWPNNYIQEAYTLKLTTDITLKKNDKLTVGVEALLFDRLFDSLMKKSSSADVDKFFSDNYFADTTVTGKLVEAVILGNSKTSDNLSDNQIITDKGTYTLGSDVSAPELGAKYKLYVDGTSVTKVSVKENDTKGYAVTKVKGSTISYTDDNKVIQTMTLPKASSYYYHGKYVNYDTAINDVQVYSSIILAKSNDSSSYDYGIIIEPYFGNPQIYKLGNTKLINQLSKSNYNYIYKNTNYKSGNVSLSDLTVNDVVYFVSDIWSKNTYVYVNDTIASGRVTLFTPNKINPTSVTINNVKYEFSDYFVRTKLNNYDGTFDNFISNTNVGDFKSLILGIDGKIVDMY